MINADSLQVLKSINKLNSSDAAKSTHTFDFSTIYTKLAHDKLQTVLQKPIDFVFMEEKIFSFC